MLHNALIGVELLQGQQYSRSITEIFTVLAETPKQNLTGLTSKFSLGHPFVWLAITLLLLLVGYVWLSIYTDKSTNTVPQQAVKKLSPEAASAQAEEIAASAAQKAAEMAMTREDDENRAKEYLEYEAVEQKILPLLDAADVHFENEQYVTPAGANAWEDYQAILAIEPAESVALSGLTKIKSRLIANAEQAIDQGEYPQAENWLVQLDQVQPDNDIQSELRQEISQLIAAEAARKLAQEEAEALRAKIQTALDQAAAEEKKTPVNYNIINDLYDRVLELDKDNLLAKTGLLARSDLKLDDAEVFLQQGDLDQARKAMDQASSISSGNKRISSLNLALDASLKQQQLALEQKQREEQRQRQEQEQKQKQLEEQKQRQEQAQVQQQQLATQQRQNQKIQQETRTASTATTTTARVEPKIDLTQDTKPASIVASGTIGTPDKKPEPVKAKAADNTLAEGIQAYYNGDYNRSFELLFPLAQEGVPRAQFRIGIMYRFGRSVSQNLDLAEKWFTAALPQLLRQAQLGEPWAQTDLGTSYEFGISLQQDYERAAYWYKKAADQGYAGAQTNLGVLYAQGDGVDYDRSKAISWLRKAAVQGDRVAADNLKILGAKP